MDIEKVKEIIAKHLKIEKDKLNLEADFKKDLHLDSIDLFQIIMEVEETFNIKIKDEELLNIKTVNDALNKIKDAK